MAEITLVGQLTPSAGIGGESTGDRLTISALDVDTSAVPNASEFSGRFVFVQGEMTLRQYPLRGTVAVLRAAQVDTTQPTSLASDAVLSGTLQGGIVRIGAETTGVELRGISVEVRLPESQDPSTLENKTVSVSGNFVLENFIERGAVWIFRATTVADRTPKPPHPHLQAFSLIAGTTVAASPSGASGDSLADTTALTVDTGVGYSDSFSFEEAFLNAVHNLPPHNTGIADFLEEVSVQNIGAQFGGFAGFSRLRITVSRPRLQFAPETIGSSPEMPTTSEVHS